jgi:GT2 family glycosyltransferase
MSRITFAIPYYENPEYLARTLKSVHAQNRSDWKAVVVDDSAGQTEAGALVRSLDDPRTTFVRNSGAHGIGPAWNRCVEAADTELVTILHADDELLPNYADVMIRAADRHPEPVAFFCPVRLIDEKGLPVRTAPDFFKRFLVPRPDRRTQTILLKGEPAARRLLQGNFLVAPSVCYRREHLAPMPFSVRWRFVLDLDLYLRLLLRGDGILGVPDVALLWRRHAGATTVRLTRTLERFREEVQFLDEMIPPLKEAGWDAAAKTARRKTVRKLHLGFLAAGDAIRFRPREAIPKLSLLAELIRDSVRR